MTSGADPLSDSPASRRAYRGNIVWRDLYRAIRHRVLFGLGRWLLKLEFPTAPRLPCRSDNHAVGSIRLTPLASRAFREGRTVWPTLRAAWLNQTRKLAQAPWLERAS